MNSLKRNRPKAFWGALISAGAGMLSSLIGGISQRNAQEEQMKQQRIQMQNQINAQNAQNAANTLNNYAAAMKTYKPDELIFAKGGKVRRRRLRNEVNITDGGVAIPLGNNTFFLRGASHQDTNETGQTGIGINVNGNEIEAENGEVLQVRDNDARVFSAQPILNGISPAEAVMAGANKDNVFKSQENLKAPRRRNVGRIKARYGIKADGSFGYIPDDEVNVYLAPSERIPSPWIAPIQTTTQEQPIGPIRLPEQNRLYEGNPWYKKSTVPNIPDPKVSSPKTTTNSGSTTTEPTTKKGLKPGVAYGVNTGLDILGSVGSALITDYFLRDTDRLYDNYEVPQFQDEVFIPRSTRVYTGARQAELERMRQQGITNVGRNTASSNDAVGRMQDVNTAYTGKINELWEDAANKRTELINQNIAAAQEVAGRNTAARNEYNRNVANMRNTLLQARINRDLLRGQNWAGMVNNITSAASNGIQNYLDYQTNGATLALGTIPYLQNNRQRQSLWNNMGRVYPSLPYIQFV